MYLNIHPPSCWHTTQKWYDYVETLWYGYNGMITSSFKLNNLKTHSQWDIQGNMNCKKVLIFFRSHVMGDCVDSVR